MWEDKSALSSGMLDLPWGDTVTDNGSGWVDVSTQGTFIQV